MYFNWITNRHQSTKRRNGNICIGSKFGPGADFRRAPDVGVVEILVDDIRHPTFFGN